MKSYNPPYTITDKMLLLVSSIAEKVSKITAYRNLDSRPHLRRNNRIKSIHSSLKIEANSLSLAQVKDVIDGRLVLGDKQEIQEVKNAYKAYGMMGGMNPYSLADLKKAQGVLTGLIQKDAGYFRSGGEGVFSGNKCVFVAPPASRVPALMKDLFCWMRANKGKVHPLILSAVFHYEFVFIHPFSDGNGRTARLWHTLLLSKWETFFEYVPIESRIEKFQKDYYEAIARSNAKGNSDDFIEFILKCIDDVLNEITEQLQTSETALSESVKKLLGAMEFETPLTSADIMLRLDLKSKETFRKNYLNPAMALGLVQMTIPEKPNSRNQRYVKK